MKTLIKPKMLKENDCVATVSLSWGGAGLLPARYNHGKKQFEDSFGVKIIEMPNSMKTQELYDDPQLRLNDLMEAFKNPEIKAILTNIGGSDTIRLLQYNLYCSLGLLFVLFYFLVQLPYLVLLHFLLLLKLTKEPY